MFILIVVFLLILTVIFFVADINNNPRINSRLTSFYNIFSAETTVEHEFSVGAESVWKALTAFERYNNWFPGIKRLFPVVNSGRYVHGFSFDRFVFEPGASFRLRTTNFLPPLRSRILVVDKNKQLLLEMKFSPLHTEQVSFDLESNGKTTELACVRRSRGLFSFLTVWGFSGKKSHLLENLGYFIPREKTKELKKSDSGSESETGLSPAFIIARAVQAGLDGNMDVINAITYKPTRGMAKAALVKAKREGGNLPGEMVAVLAGKEGKVSPEAGAADSSGPDSSTVFANKDDLVAYSVNEFLDGNEEAVNDLTDRVLRGKAKALLVKIKRGSVERPARPEQPRTAVSNKMPAKTENEDELIKRLITAGLDGNMDEINALDSRVLRGKIKAAIVKAKRAGN
ncbi:MAG: hypothetical protein V3S22_02440 [Candidatus Neomarinimicrobiota bacterium]